MGTELMSAIAVENGYLIDPYAGICGKHTVRIENGTVSEAGNADGAVRIDADGLLVFPGLIDFHCHLYQGSAFGVDPDLMLSAGVTSACDAGTAGAIGFGEFRRNTLQKSILTLRAFLNVSSIGQPGGGIDEPLDDKAINRDVIAEVYEQNRDLIIGLKVRISRGIVGELGLKPFQKALEIAEDLGLPLNVHVTDPPVPRDELVRYFRPGDVFTHLYAGKGHTIVENGGIGKELWEAKERGVIFDAANGRSNFCFSVAEKAISEDFFPDVISTDTTAYNFMMPYQVKNLPFIRSKYLMRGMALEDVVKAVTAVPAHLMGLDGKIGTLAPGASGDVVICRLEDKDTVFRDTAGEERTGHRILNPVMVIKKGRVVYTSPDFM